MQVLLAQAATAQLIDESINQSADQSQGYYQPMNMGYAGFSSLGMIQSAWQDPLQNLGEGQSKPAYSRYYWSPDLVLPVRLREKMITILNFPEWELLENVYIGDKESFGAKIISPNTLMMFPQPGAPIGVDTNAVIFGRSGNKYTFYIRSEGFNTERLTNSIIDIDVVGSGASGGRPSSSTGMVSGGSGGIYTGNDSKLADATYTRRFLKEDWLKSIPIDPEKFRFDIEIYVPNPDDVVIAPERVWHDDIFTYIDLGEKALNMIQRPIVTLIVERSETPVGFRTKGPNNRLIIVEGVGDMVMRSGKRMVCLKLRRSDDDGAQYVEYADDSNSWDVGPKIPSATNGDSDQSSASDEMKALYPNGLKDGDKIDGAKVSTTTDDKGALIIHNGGFSANDLAKVSISDNNSGGYTTTEKGVVLGNGIVSAQTEVDYASISGAQKNIAQNPYAQYGFGSGFANLGGDKLSIELGIDDNVNNLENLWHDLSSKYSTVLSGYEPFYSVDTPADGQGKELFHLRVGPVKDLDSGDKVCSQLGRNGVFCSVVRMQ